MEEQGEKDEEEAEAEVCAECVNAGSAVCVDAAVCPMLVLVRMRPSLASESPVNYNVEEHGEEEEGGG
jgi:hypothetical protein